MLLHCLVALVWAVACISSPFIKEADPKFFNEAFFPTYATASLLMVAAWPLLGGCYLTRLENRLRQMERKLPYHGSFMGYYFQCLTGIRLHGWIVTAVQLAIILVPVYVRFSDRLPSW